MLMSKETMGKIASDLMQKTPDSLDPIEIQRATEKEYLDNLIWAVEHAQKKVDCSHIEGHDYCKQREPFEGDFYIAALLKKEKLLQNVLRNYFVPTRACPTPHFDQTVYKYHAGKGDIQFLWVVPDQETCEIFRENIDKIVPEERGLLKYILDYYDGTLFQYAKHLNGEKSIPGVALEGKSK
jgi:hypothetical protein